MLLLKNTLNVPEAVWAFINHNAVIPSCLRKYVCVCVSPGSHLRSLKNETQLLG